MSSDKARPASRSQGPGDGERLDSWKEIAAYLKRDVRTLHRWESEEGLPIHRHVHKKRGTVYAYKSDSKDGGTKRAGGYRNRRQPQSPTGVSGGSFCFHWLGFWD